MTPLKSIKAFCIWCLGGNRNLVEGCTAPECPLFKYRNGKLNQSAKMSPKKAEAFKRTRERLQAIKSFNKKH